MLRHYNMFMVMIYNDFENKILNGVRLFDKIKDIILWSKGIIKYNDLTKEKRIYKTYKSFFRIIEVHIQDESYYFAKKRMFKKQINI